ncbi:MAG: chromosomal replication initiator protein DnaA [Gemmatimonadales bacterium]|nr:MAG: chromosomal replication initiator protein DnaA [Gemmatimonadales bacterium]
MELTPTDLWSRVLASARTGMPEQSFRTWLAGSRAVGLTEDVLLVEAPSDFHVEWIEDKYGPALSEIVERILGRPLRLAFKTSQEALPSNLPSLEVNPQADPSGGVGPSFPESTTAAPSPGGRGSDDRRNPGRSGSPAPDARNTPAANLNDRYTFDRFVVGSNNQLAAAASHAVAEQPARTYNPLFLYGGVGLGKTHLMHAVGHAVLNRDPTRKVAYVTTESFMNELVGAIQRGTTGDFRRRFRQIDLLLVDDVHFLGGKEGTQEEFFHTFNALYDAGKQVVLTSDRPPKELPGVEDRLVSRFEWGLVVDIKPPDYETRVAILRKKATDDHLTLDDEVMDFIARSCTSSVRELEGAVIKLLAYSSLRREEITLEMARMALQGMLREGGAEARRITPDLIRERVARAWDVPPESLSSKRRTREITEPRQVAMFLIRELLDRSLQNIGALFGGRDHSTVIYAIKKVQQRIEEDPDFAQRVSQVREALSED